MDDLKVKDVMTHLVVTLRPTDTLHEAAARLAQSHVSGAPVTEAGRVVGVISESDILKALAPRARNGRLASILDWITNVGEHASGAPARAQRVADAMSDVVIEVRPDASIWEAADMLTRYGINRLPVVNEDGFLVGIVSRADVVRVMGRDDEAIRADVLAAINVVGADTIADVVVTVKDGLVTLTGTADRKSTKEIVLRVARRVPGVAGIDDRLTYELDDDRAHILTKEEERFIFGPTRH